MNMTTEEEQKIVSAFGAGKSGKVIALEFEVSASTVSNVLRKHNIKPKTGRRPSCSIDHTAFDTITPSSAYWMGFLFADGCLSETEGGSPQLSLELATKDRDHVEKFRTFLKSTHAIRDVTRGAGTIENKNGLTSSTPQRTAVAFAVRSQQLADALRKNGFCKKGPERTPTEDLEKSLDFWRGTIDGDGTVRIVEDHRGYDYKYASLILCGHIPLLEKFQSFLRYHNISANITDTTSGIFQIRMMGSNALTMIKMLYDNAHDYLDRKMASAKEVMATCK